MVEKLIPHHHKGGGIRRRSVRHGDRLLDGNTTSLLANCKSWRRYDARKKNGFVARQRKVAFGRTILKTLRRKHIGPSEQRKNGKLCAQMFDCRTKTD